MIRKPIMRWLTASLYMCAFVSPVFAAEERCPPGSGIDRTECIERNLKSAEVELKSVFVKAMAEIDSSEFIPKVEREKWKSEAHKAQHSWQTYRDVECQSVTPYYWYGGSGSGVGGAVSSCMLEKTQARIKELRRVTQ